MLSGEQSFRQKQLLRRHKNLYHTPDYVPPAPKEKSHECGDCNKVNNPAILSFFGEGLFENNCILSLQSIYSLIKESTWNKLKQALG